MKTFKSILIIIVVLPLTLAILGGVKTNTENKKSEEVVNIEETKEFCYIWNTEAGDKATLTMKQNKESVEGEFRWFPYGKDSKVGTFKGNILKEDNNSQVVNAIWEAKAEGMIVDEELRIILNESIASPGFGEMKNRGDGVFIYAFPEKIYYGPNLIQTDCEDEAIS